MQGWIRTLQTAAWGAGIGIALVLILLAETYFKWGWSTAGNWGYFVLAAFIGIGLAIFSALLALCSGIAILILRARRNAQSDSPANELAGDG